MNLMILAVGVFGGVAVAMATFYSLARAVMVGGKTRYAHGLIIAVTLLVMASLQWGTVEAARLFALPLFGGAVWAFSIEDRLYKLFPLIQQLLAVALLAGLVSM